MSKRHILVLYYQRFQFPLRQNFKEHLRTFDLIPDCKVFYVNTAFGIPSYLHKIRFDLVVIHSLLIAHYRWRKIPIHKASIIQKNIGDIDAVKIAFPQDEFFNTEFIEDLLLKANVQSIFSVANPSEWKKIYPKSLKKNISVFPVLTGYLNSQTVEKTKARCKKLDRPIDLGYRAWKGAFWAGKHALLKGEITKAFELVIKGAPLSSDLSTRDSDLFLGKSWLNFLLGCKYTLGVEGGSSILDKNGAIKECVEQYVCKHPEATYMDVESNCFPGQENSLNLKALSPRHLEACMTKTCQVLVEGAYNGILKPGEHYIELKKDFGNINDVVQQMVSDSKRKEIVEKAYHDIVESENYTYEKFATSVLLKSLENVKIKEKRVFDYLMYLIVKLRGYLVTLLLYPEAIFFQIVKKIVCSILMEKPYKKLKNLRDRLAGG